MFIINIYIEMTSAYLRIEQKPLSDADLRTILCDNLKIIKYSELESIDSLEELLPNSKDDLIMLYETEEDSGHWVAMLRYTDVNNYDRIEFFDPYVYRPDSELNWISKKMREKLGQDVPYLTRLINKANENARYPKVMYSPYHFESENKKINTCGHHSAHRIYSLEHNNMDLTDYYSYMEEARRTLKLTYDEVVSEFVQSYGI